VHGLDRDIDGLPTEAELVSRTLNRQGLTRPEIAVLLAHSKKVVRDDLLASDAPDHPDVRAVLYEYFPASIRRRFDRWIPGHRLAREIVATCLANDLVNHLGPGLIQRLDERFGAETRHVVLALAAVRSVFGIGSMSFIGYDTHGPAGRAQRDGQVTVVAGREHRTELIRYCAAG